MAIRQLKLPDDLMPIIKIAAETWIYPENPEWSVQPDEQESMEDSMANYQRIWPIIRTIQLFSPVLRDLMLGHVWEENGRIAGFTQLGRRGSTDTWLISAVGVHPDFRRRGIAQKLVTAAIDLIRERGGKRISLDVIEGNIPAVNLYTKLDFENFTANLEMAAKPETAPTEPFLPAGYSLEFVDDYSWQPRFELMQRITPEAVRHYEPVEEGRFKRPLLMRLVFPIIKRAEGLEIHRIQIRDQAGQVEAYAMYDIRTRESGRNTINAHLDQAHPELAVFLVNYMLYHVITANPDRAIDFNVPIWQEALVNAAQNAGFEIRVKLLTLGLLL